MSAWKKLLATSAAAGGGLNVEDVFSTTLYETNNTSITVTTGIDGTGDAKVLYWAKPRVDASADDHALVDNVRQTSSPFKRLTSNNTDEEKQSETGLSSFTSTGFTAGQANYFNGNLQGSNSGGGVDEVVWGFKAAPKFFDVVTYTGNDVAGRTISHNLNGTVGCFFIKRLDTAKSWWVYHRGTDSTAPEDYYLRLESTAAKFDSAGLTNDTPPTSSVITLGNNQAVNQSGGSYVAYIFAHNDGDGDFGPTGDQDIIKCGSYTGNGSTDGPEINLGFEPQWLLYKNTSTAGTAWVIVDNMRGIATGGDDALLQAQTSGTELSSGYNYNDLQANGFKVTTTADGANTNGNNYIYIAIRRGPMAVPTDATDVFQVGTVQNNTPKDVSPASDFPVDFVLHHAAANSSTGNKLAINRLANDLLYTNLTGGAYGNYSSYSPFDHMDNVQLTGLGAANGAAWMWRRAPNYFDVVAYTGNGTAGRTVSHNLGVAPEMMWVKRRSNVEDWLVYHSSTGNQAGLGLNETAAAYTGVSTFWNSTTPTDSVFTLGTHNRVNTSGETYIAYLFASVDGVSKVGSYDGTGGTNTQVIDCGFSAGARFVLLKRYNASGYDWQVFDTERGITSGNDAKLALNTTAAESTLNWGINPNSSGFEVTGNGLNETGGSWIFYAIA